MYSIIHVVQYVYCTHTIYVPHAGGMCIVLVFTTVRTSYVAPIQGVSQQEVTRLVILLTV